MKIMVVTKDNCSWCVKAKELLEENKISYDVVEYGKDITPQNFQVIAPGVKTVPAVFINDYYIGGYQDLEEHIDSINQYLLFESMLKNGKIRVVFTKADGEERVAHATLKPDLLPTQEITESVVTTPKKPRKPSLTSIRYYDLDKEDFRSFRFDSVISIENSD